MRCQFILLFLLFPSAILLAQGDDVPPFAQNLDRSLDQVFKAAMRESTLESSMPTVVQRELRLSPDQIDKLESQIKAISTKQLDKYVSSITPDSDATAKEAVRRECRDDQLGEIRLAIESTLDSNQMMRLRQIENQGKLEDVFSSTGPDVLGKALNLTDEQKARLKEASERIDETVRLESQLLMLRLMRAELNAVLSEEQRTHADQLLGEPLGAARRN